MAILIERKRRRRRKLMAATYRELCLMKQQQLQEQDIDQDSPDQTGGDLPNATPSNYDRTMYNDTRTRLPIQASTTDCFLRVKEPQNGHSPVGGEIVSSQHCKARLVAAGQRGRTQTGYSRCWQLNRSLSAICFTRQSLSLSMLLLLLLPLALTLSNLSQFVSASNNNNGVNILNTNLANNQMQQQGSFLSSGSNSVIQVAPATTSNAKARYKTMYACEDRQLTMDCDFGSKINLIRANYGRFSITQCNEQGQLDLSTDCMSPITFRIMRERCQDKQKCSVNATSSIFGDKCPKTRKYLEVHFQCQPDPRVGSPSMMEPPDRVDLRNSSLISPSVSHVVYPQVQNIGLASGSSSILPPNNPTINQHSHHLQQGNSGARPQLASSAFGQSDDSIAAVQSQQPPPRPQFQPYQPQQLMPQQLMTVMNSEILSYNVINDLKSAYNPNNISSEPNRATEPIMVTLRHTHTENMSNPRCVLWDAAANQWTERGSQIIESNLTHTTCAFDQATSYLLVMDYLAPFPTISQINPALIQNQSPAQIATQPSVPQNIGTPFPGMLDLQPVVLDSTLNKNGQQQHQHQPTSASSLVRFLSVFGYLLAVVFVVIALMTIAFIASTMKSSAGAALKSLGNFAAFGVPKYKNRRADGALHNKDFLVVNNQNGHQFFYAPANTTKINSSASTHMLSGSVVGQHQNTLHHIQQSIYSGNGTLSNLSGTGAQSNNYYYDPTGLTNLFHQQQQQSQQLQHHMSQHHLNQQQQQTMSPLSQQQTMPPVSYHHQANKSTISNESANSTPSSSGVESGSTSIQQQQQQQQQQQASCLLMGNDCNLMGHLTNYGQHQNLIPASHQPTLTLNTHYNSSGAPMMSMTSNLLSQQQRINISAHQNNNSSIEGHVYESVDDEKPYSARLLLSTNIDLSDQFNSNTLGQHQALNGQQQQMNASRALTLSSRAFQNAIHQQQINQNQSQTNKRLFPHPAIVRDNNQAKTNIICSKLAQITPQRATEINKFQQDVMAIYNGIDTTTTTANGVGNTASSGYGQSGDSNCSSSKLSTDC